MTRSVARTEWHPASWQSLAAAQQPSYPDKAALERAIADLSRLPPIVTTWEIEALKEQIAKAQRGEAFVLQGGDCAESFDNCTSDNIVAKLKILLQKGFQFAICLHDLTQLNTIQLLQHKKHGIWHKHIVSMTGGFHVFCMALWHEYWGS